MLQFQTTFVQIDPSCFKSSSQQVWELQFMNNKQVVMTLMHLRWLFTGAVLFSASLMNVLIFRRKINIYYPGVWEWGYGISGRRWMTLRCRFMIFPCCVRCQPELPFSFHRITICFGWKECLTLNNKTRNNVAKWEIKGRSVKRATPDNFYCRLLWAFRIYKHILSEWVLTGDIWTAFHFNSDKKCVRLCVMTFC